MNKINGYLECNGIIMRITSIDDLITFVNTYNTSKNIISEKELDELTNVNSSSGETFCDDCKITYLTKPQVLIGGYKNASYKIKDNTVAIANNAFAIGRNGYHSIIQAVRLPNSILSIGNSAFYDNRALQTVVMSQSIIKIGESAFKSCVSLSNIQFPDSLRIIGTDAFNFTALKEIVIPQNIERIGSHAFSSCDNLVKVRFRGIPTYVGSGLFDYCNNIEKIYIPKGSKSAFKEKLFGVNEELLEEQ